jgi:hypothetical protein
MFLNCRNASPVSYYKQATQLNWLRLSTVNLSQKRVSGLVQTWRKNTGTGSGFIKHISDDDDNDDDDDDNNNNNNIY